MLLSATYHDAEKANAAVEQLVETAFDADEIGLLVADRFGVHDQMVAHDTGVAEGAVVGGALGATLSAVGIALTATGVLAAPGLPLLAAGPLLAAIEGAIGGGVVGGAVGALMGLGFWKEEADLHAEDIAGGSVMVSVHAEGEHLEAARRIFRGTGADRIRG
jgi:hypothetical protein